MNNNSRRKKENEKKNFRWKSKKRRRTKQNKIHLKRNKTKAATKNWSESDFDKCHEIESTISNYWLNDFTASRAPFVECRFIFADDNAYANCNSMQFDILNDEKKKKWNERHKLGDAINRFSIFSFFPLLVSRLLVRLFWSFVAFWNYIDTTFVRNNLDPVRSPNRLKKKWTKRT